MWYFKEIGEQIKASMLYKEYKAGGLIKAAKCKTLNEFELLKTYWANAFVSCYNPTPRIIDGEYRGEDWYFIERVDIDRGMEGHQELYWIEALSQKKKNSTNFCRNMKARTSKNEKDIL